MTHGWAGESRKVLLSHSYASCSSVLILFFFLCQIKNTRPKLQNVTPGFLFWRTSRNFSRLQYKTSQHLSFAWTSSTGEHSKIIKITYKLRRQNHTLRLPWLTFNSMSLICASFTAFLSLYRHNTITLQCFSYSVLFWFQWCAIQVNVNGMKEGFLTTILSTQLLESLV